MVFRKPYAFLIKNFRKIHILMLLLCIFVYLKVAGISRFVADYISYGSYSASLESFTSKAGFLFYLSLIFIVGISLTLIILLKRKAKPWKIYLIYIVEYLFLFFTVIFISRYFASYSVTTSISGVLIYRDMLNIAKIFQYPIFILLIIRILGIDLKKFNFSSDEEFLELSSEDREEFEVSFEFDKNSIKRLFNRTKRNLNYFYQEHRFICNVVFTCFLCFTVFYSYYYFGIVHKSYKQGKTFTTGLYDITIKNSYVSDKDFAGNKIEKGSKFVVILMTIKNNSNKSIDPNLYRYHLVNGSTDRSYNVYYNTYFTDVGKPVEAKLTLKGGGSKTFYMVYKVKDDLNNNRFVLYYQELGGKLVSYLRKIKLKVEDVSLLKDVGNYNIGKKVSYNYISGSIKEVIFNSYEVGNNFNYNRYYCTNVCSMHYENLVVPAGYNILKINFSSSDFEGEEFIDFSSNYGKIKYIDSKGKVKYSDILDAIDMSYQGKDIYIKAKSEVLSSSELAIVYTLRNKRYTIKLR